MSKPHDKIMTLNPGEFFADPVNKVLRVEIVSITELSADVMIGTPANYFAVQHNTAQALSDMFAHLAIQLKPTGK